MKSDGWYHERNSFITLTTLAIISMTLSLTGNWILGLGLIIGGICGLFIDPDLDQRTTTRAENRMYRINPLLGAVFHIYWIPYSLLPHRSVLTHGGFPPFGWVTMALIATPLRILYTFCWAIIPVVKLPELSGWLVGVPVAFWVSVYVGWYSQDVVHWLRDYM
jgi:hypothetical protein